MKFNIKMKPKKIDLKNLNIEFKKIKISKEKKIAFIIISVLVIITMFSGISLGKTIHNNYIKSNTQIAKPNLEVEKNSEIQITEDKKEGEYIFKVKNYNTQDEVSEVDLKYYVEILENNKDTCLKYELYKENENIEIKDNKTMEFKLNKDEKKEDIYVLKIYYDSNKNNLGDIIKDIQIKVHSEQLKI